MEPLGSLSYFSSDRCLKSMQIWIRYILGKRKITTWWMCRKFCCDKWWATVIQLSTSVLWHVTNTYSTETSKKNPKMHHENSELF
jgi:hypothetical protein